MPSIGLGTYNLRDAKCVEIVQKALTLGYRHIDTAGMYGNELEIGKAIELSSVSRNDVFITTKVWPHNFQAPHFVNAVEQSLKYLKTDYLDLVLLHWPRDEIPLEETLGALEKVIKAGKVRHGGVSNFSVTQLDEAVRIAPTAVRCNQVKCHLGALPFGVIQRARELGVAVTAYSPLGQGAVHADERLNQLAEKYQCTSSQVALRWLSQQGIAVIPKTANAHRLQENFLSDHLNLSDDDLAQLGRL